MAGHIAGVAELMLSGLHHKRHQDGRNTRGADFAHGHRTGAADHHVALKIGLIHVMDEFHHFGLNTQLVVARLDGLDVALARLMQNARTLVFVKQRKRLGHRFVQHLGAETAAEHEQLHRAGTAAQALFRSWQRFDLRAHGVARDAALFVGGAAGAAGKTAGNELGLI